MRKINIHRLFLTMVFMSNLLALVYAQEIQPLNTPDPASPQKNEVDKYRVTFIELGSVRCIPCQKMQVVMKAIKEKYGTQVKVVFHDVWTPEGKPFGKKYGIEEIPTQVFLDKNGKEFSRHVGYLPEEDLVKILRTEGVK
jgi:thioredoxin 1